MLGQYIIKFVGGGGGAAVETGEIGNKGADEGAEIEQERETRLK